MKLENQVCSLELAKRLKELGVKQESYFYWDKTPMLLIGQRPEKFGCISAFTVAELGEMLPWYLMIDGKVHWLTQKYDDDGPWLNYDPERKEPGIGQPSADENDSEANIRAKMLIHLIENKLIQPTENGGGK